jgi:hypothetical protein
MILVLLTLLASLVVASAVSAEGGTSPLGTEFRVSIADEDDLTTVGRSTSFSDIAMDGDGDSAFLMFDPYSEWRLVVRLYDPMGQPKGSQFTVAEYGQGDLLEGSIAMDNDGDFIVVWGGNYARLYRPNGTPKGPAFKLAGPTGNAGRPSVSMDDDGDFVVVWVQSNLNPVSYEVLAQRYFANGAPQGGPITLAGPIPSNSTLGLLGTDVAVDADGDFVAAWNWRDDAACGSYVQRVSNTGQLQGTPIAVAGCQGYLNGTRVVSDAVRNFAVVWTAPDQSESGIFARRYLADGTPNGAAFQVNTSTDYFQEDPEAAMNAAGKLYIIWTWNYREKPGELEAGREIYGQLYNPNGSKLGGEFKVNSWPGGVPYGKGAVMDDEGDFAAGWTSVHQDGGNDGVYGQYNHPVRPNIPLLVSLLADGRVRGLAYKKGDILQYDPGANAWSIYFDASDYGIAANIGDFELLPDHDLLLVFKSSVNLAGLGKVMPHDIVRFDTATNTFSLYFDGSDVGLAANSEYLDAIGLEKDGALLLSTAGGISVPNVSAWDEDIVRFRPTLLGSNTNGVWSTVLKGEWWGNYKDLWSIWIDTVSPDTYYYMTFERPIRVNNGDLLVPNGGVLRCRPFYPQEVPDLQYSDCIVDLYWSGAAAGLASTAKIDGLELNLP